MWQPHQFDVIAIDLLKFFKIHTIPCAIIVNLDLSTEPGSHWVAIYLPECTVAERNGCVAEYFCSFASEILLEIRAFFCRQCKHSGIVKATVLPFQNPFSTTCGLWALDYIVHKSWGVPTESYISQFDDDFLANEKILKSRWGGDIDDQRFIYGTQYFN